ncbi:MAG: glycosyltransferase family 4 protein [Anaerolineae bacterium]
MHILFLTPSFPPKIGGGERYAHMLATRLTREGHCVTVITGDAQREDDFWRPQKPGPVTETQEGMLRVIRCPMAGLPGGFAALSLWRKAMIVRSALPGPQIAQLEQMARRVPHIPALADALATLGETPDLVHAFNLSWEYPLIEARRYAAQHDLPLVVTPFYHPGTERRDRVALNHTMAHQRRVLSEADAVTTLTDIERRHLLELGLSPERVHVLGSGIDVPAITSDDKEEAAPDDLAQPLVLFIGRVGHDKGALHAAEAVRALNDRGTHATLALVGPTAPEFKRYHRRLPIAERAFIRPLGVVDEDTKQHLLSRSRALVLPSRVESFGLVFLEAWSHGVPVIGARAGGIPDVIDHGVNGFLVDYGDVAALAAHLHMLLEDRPLATRMGERGRQKLTAVYTWDTVCERLLTLYRQVLIRRGHRPSTGENG